MLNKDTCKKCINKHRTNWKWGEGDEASWRYRQVYCPAQFISDMKLLSSKINSFGTKFCPYSMEHMVLGQDNAK